GNGHPVEIDLLNATFLDRLLGGQGRGQDQQDEERTENGAEHGGSPGLGVARSAAHYRRIGGRRRAASRGGVPPPTGAAGGAGARACGATTGGLASVRVAPNAGAPPRARSRGMQPGGGALPPPRHRVKGPLFRFGEPGRFPEMAGTLPPRLWIVVACLGISA